MDCISVSPSANHVKIDIHRVDARSLTNQRLFNNSILNEDK